MHYIFFQYNYIINARYAKLSYILVDFDKQYYFNLDTIYLFSKVLITKYNICQQRWSTDRVWLQIWFFFISEIKKNNVWPI